MVLTQKLRRTPVGLMGAAAWNSANRQWAFKSDASANATSAWSARPLRCWGRRPTAARPLGRGGLGGRSSSRDGVAAEANRTHESRSTVGSPAAAQSPAGETARAAIFPLTEQSLIWDGVDPRMQPSVDFQGGPAQSRAIPGRRPVCPICAAAGSSAMGSAHEGWVVTAAVMDWQLRSGRRRPEFPSVG